MLRRSRNIRSIERSICRPNFLQQSPQEGGTGESEAVARLVGRRPGAGKPTGVPVPSPPGRNDRSSSYWSPPGAGLGVALESVTQTEANYACFQFQPSTTRRGFAPELAEDAGSARSVLRSRGASLCTVDRLR